MPYSENQTIATIDDASAARSAIYGAVRILAARWGIDLTPEDAAELQTILDAADRLHAYHQTIRAAVSADERAKKGLRTI